MNYCAAIALTLINLVYVTVPVLASPSLSNTVLKQSAPTPPDRGAPGDRLRGGGVWYTPPAPPERGMPEGRTRGGASRGNCAPTAQPLTALAPSIPMNQATTTHPVWGLTTAERPTFWFYVPYALDASLPVEFVLLDEQDTVVYQTNFSATSPAGIVNITPPSTTPPLEVGRLYRWYFLIYCSPENPLFTQGGIQRITPSSDLTTTLQQATPRERAALYATNGIWFDALTTLATLRQNEPNNAAIAADWSSLLESGELTDVAQYPLIPCCTPR